MQKKHLKQYQDRCQDCGTEVFRKKRKDRPGQYRSPPKYCDQCRKKRNAAANKKNRQGGYTYRDGYRYVLDPAKSRMRGKVVTHASIAM